MLRDMIPLDDDKIVPPPRIAVVISPYYQEIAEGLYKGAKDYLVERGVLIADEDVFMATGAFEIPLLAKKLAETGAFDGIICLGCIIKGKTENFYVVSSEMGSGIMESMLKTGVPIALGIIVATDKQIAIDRSKEGAANYGTGAASAVANSIVTLREIAKIKAPQLSQPT